MPTAGWKLPGSIVVVDERNSAYLVLNRDTGSWCVTNRAGVQLIDTGAKPEPDWPASISGLVNNRPKPATGGGLNQFFVIYKLTDACNYHCSYCYDHKIARKKNAASRGHSVRDVLDGLLNAGSRVNLLFHGGEPLLEFGEIKSLVEEYRARYGGRIQFSMQTNLSLLSAAALDFLQDYDVGISVSVDGTSTEANRLRVIGGMDDPYRVIQTKMATMNRLTPDRLGLLVTVGPHNCERLPEMLVRMQSDGFRSVSFSLLQNVNKTATPATADLLTALYATLCNLIVAGDVKKLAIWSVIQWIRRVVNGNSSLVCMDAPCGAGRSLITVFPSGEIGPCDSIFDDRYYAGSPSEYWSRLATDPLLIDLRTRDIRGVSPCNECDVLPMCNGTCPGSVILEHGKLEGVTTSECEFQFRWITELMWMLGDPVVGATLLAYSGEHSKQRELLVSNEGTEN